MSLNFSTEKCTDRTYIDDVRPDGTEVWHPAVQSMTFATMSLGIPRITEDNWEKFYERYTQHNVALGQSDTEWWYLTPPMVKSFIGFFTNASAITDHKWKLELADTVMRTAERREEARKRPFEVRFTGERITEESAGQGDAAERGWVNPSWNRKQLYPKQADVRATGFDTREEAEEFIESIIGSYTTDDGENYYAEDSDLDKETGDYWKYAAHIEEVKK